MGQFLRIIIILIVLWLVLQIIKRALSRREKSDGPSSAARMLACDRCGVHVPEHLAVREGEKIYCCEAHRKTVAS